MLLGIIYLLLPLVIYVVAVSLAAGRTAVIGCGIIGALIVFTWLSKLFTWAPLYIGDAYVDSYADAAVVIWTGAFFFGALVQVIRHFLPQGRPAWVYPVLAVAVLIVAGYPAITLLGF